MVNTWLYVRTYTETSFYHSIFVKMLYLFTVDLQVLKCDVQMMLDAIGGDPTEAACEVECHNILQEGHVLNFACPIVCLG